MRNERSGARAAVVAVSALVLVAGVACSSGGDATGVGEPTRVALQSVSPASGGTGVAITMPMAMQFSGPLGAGMEKYVALHEASVTGPIVAGRWRLSEDRRTLTFTPDVALKARTTYVIHMGGGMQGQNGMPVDNASCSAQGGRGVTSRMMGGAGTGMMGAGWQGTDGGYGMIFTFTTG